MRLEGGFFEKSNSEKSAVTLILAGIFVLLFYKTAKETVPASASTVTSEFHSSQTLASKILLVQMYFAKLDTPMIMLMKYVMMLTNARLYHHTYLNLFLVMQMQPVSTLMEPIIAKVQNLQLS